MHQVQVHSARCMGCCLQRNNVWERHPHLLLPTLVIRGVHPIGPQEQLEQRRRGLRKRQLRLRTLQGWHLQKTAQAWRMVEDQNLKDGI